MARFRSRPSEVEAIQWQQSHEGLDEVVDFADDRVRTVGTPPPGSELHHLELLAGRDGETGWIPVPPGWWVLRWRDDDSDYWPMDPDSFQTKYERIEDA